MLVLMRFCSCVGDEEDEDEDEETATWGGHEALICMLRRCKALMRPRTKQHSRLVVISTQQGQCLGSSLEFIP